ncbi:hypothetical protein SRHO_G00092620 [Serrasalmus rhombeus]
MLATGLMRLRDSEWTETCSHSIEVLLLLLCLQVNTGRMNFPREKWDLIIGNLALKQVQATVLGFLAVLAASPLGWAHDEKLVTVIVNYAALLCCSSVVTAFTASLLQMATYLNVVSFPQASLWFFDFVEPSPCIVYMVRVLFLCLTPVWVIISLRHPESRRLLYCSCKPIITAMVTSRAQQQNCSDVAAPGRPRSCLSLHHLSNARWPHKPKSNFHHSLLSSSFYTGISAAGNG